MTTFIYIAIVFLFLIALSNINNQERQLSIKENPTISKNYIKNNPVRCNINKDSQSNSLYCPKCNSYNISINKKGFGVGKATFGVVSCGVLGLLGGFIGSNDVKMQCLNCGNKFKSMNK